MEYQSSAVRPIGAIEEGWKTIKDDYWVFFGMTAVAFVILFAVAMIVGLIANLITAGISAVVGVSTANTSDAVRLSASLVPQLISMVISIFTNIIVGALSGVLFCGVYAALARKTTTGKAEFGDLFSQFSKVKECLIVSAVIAILQFVLSLVLLLGGAAVGVSAVGLQGMITKNGQINPAIFGSLFAIIAVFVLIYAVFNLIISALTSFAYPLIAERGVSGVKALALSAKAALSNIFGLIGLLILCGLMAFGGLLVCLVGIFFVAPLLTASLFAAYRSVFGAYQDNLQYNPPPPPNFGNQPGY